jgi:hypothetical protein
VHDDDAFDPEIAQRTIDDDLPSLWAAIHDRLGNDQA